MATDQDDEVTRLVVLDSVEDAIPAIERGEAELVVRDEDREDERDFVLAAELATAEQWPDCVGPVSASADSKNTRCLRTNRTRMGNEPGRSRNTMEGPSRCVNLRRVRRKVITHVSRPNRVGLPR